LENRVVQHGLLITFHPVTLEQSTSAKQMGELLAALAELEDTDLIFTMPNADTEGRVVFRQIEDFCRLHPYARAYTSLGQLRYLSCIQHFDGVVGNSSSGLAEVPSFSKGTINIGDRQLGRLRATSVIDCEPDRKSITEALSHLFSVEFQGQLPDTKNPYGDGGASEAVVRMLEQQTLDNLLKKCFFDISSSNSCLDYKT
jgi:GDP/UDP-N,N'-diacetylbacillosamine 2-epimerase (hydrolysing)